MFVLVTGGAGFIGSHTVDALLSLCARVRVLDDLSTGSLNNLSTEHTSLEFIQGNILDEACVVNCMQGITHVLHLAAQVSVPISIQDPVHSHLVNVTGYLNVLNAARMAGVRRVVHASSAAVYGAPIELPLTEDSQIAPLSPYGLEKYITDQYAQLFSALYGLSTLGLRYFNVYGPRQDPRSPYSGVISKFAAWAREGSPFTVCGDGMQTRDFIYVKDVAQANIAALQSPYKGVINVATGKSVTLLDMVQIFSSCVGHPIEVNNVSARGGDISYSSVVPSRMRSILNVHDTVQLNAGIAQLIAEL